ncbi:unnamed protein product [Nezara viridula]|uniref:Uncharacterized protein n=1 Tax=Nezara viridula TaxID=85310 RepID=A0A9P0HSA1_NEZVI|nr:unnamed protein product [Nezara viridula]
MPIFQPGGTLGQVVHFTSANRNTNPLSPDSRRYIKYPGTEDHPTAAPSLSEDGVVLQGTICHWSLPISYLYQG